MRNEVRPFLRAEKGMRYAEVAVNSPVSQRRLFSYQIPPSLELAVGQAVWVPFGPRLLQGIVVELSDYPAVSETREVLGALGGEPLLTPAQVELARWISEQYLSSLFDALALMLPPGFEQRTITFLRMVAAPQEARLPDLAEPERRLLRLLQGGSRISYRQAEKALGKKAAKSAADRLRHLGIITQDTELQKPRIGPKFASFLYLRVAEENIEQEIERLKQKAPRQSALLSFLKEAASPVPLSQVRNTLGIELATIRGLERKALVSLRKERVRRDPLARLGVEASPPVKLTPDQQTAWQSLRQALDTTREKATTVFLLHGVAGSGKTELYLRALSHIVARGKRGIVLVPEISLTPQTVARLASHFPGRVSLLHSRLSPGEQFDEWEWIKGGNSHVVIGSRSALFAPQPDLGLIIIDEEHEWTYKQEDQAPRYHAREVAIKLAALTGATVILGSATPDIGSYHKAQRGEYRLLHLPQRFGSFPPLVKIVDLRKELKEGNRSIFSRPLASAMDRCLQAGEQAILFLNRRGTSSFVQCRSCGFVLSCRRCEVALTHHSDTESLVCHQCNSRLAVPDICPRCSSRRIKFLGTGTEKVEQEAHHFFPRARLLRWDRDTARGGHSHQEMLDKFLAHQADILVGTQMIAKGLDLPLVTLVGVVNADVGLHIPDFRSAERTFQVVSQVAGRAGRRELPGMVFIQTYSPDHYAVQAAASLDYEAFYLREIAYRRQQGNPPFNRLARLLYSHTNQLRCEEEAKRMRHLLSQEKEARGIPDLEVLGPAPAFIPRVRGRWRWQLLLRGADPASLLSTMPVPQGWVVDIDPVGLP